MIKKLTGILMLLLFYNLTAFASMYPEDESSTVFETTNAATLEDCVECEENRSIVDEADAINGLSFKTYKPDEFDGVITLNIRDMNTGDLTAITLSEENEYIGLTDHSNQNVSITTLLESSYNYEFYADTVIGEVCEKGYLLVDVIIDYKLIDTEQREDAFDVDDAYLAYLESLEDVSDDFGLKEDSRISNPNEVIKQVIEEYEALAEASEQKDAANGKTAEIAKVINSDGLYIGIFAIIGLAIVILVAAVVIYRIRIEED